MKDDIWKRREMAGVSSGGMGRDWLGLVVEHILL